MRSGTQEQETEVDAQTNRLNYRWIVGYSVREGLTRLL